MSPARSSLGQLERAVMDVLWADESEDGMSVRDVLDALIGRKLAYTTVMTVLSRLTTKEFVARKRDGRAWRYRPVATRESMTAQAMRDPLGELSHEDKHSAILHFINEATPAEIEAMRAAMAEVEARAEAPRPSEAS